MPTITEDDFSDPEDELLPQQQASRGGAQPQMDMEQMAKMFGGADNPLAAMMGGAGAGGQPSAPSQASMGKKRSSEPPPESKTWTTVYPIYVDKKRPFKRGERRVSSDKAVMWPVAHHIAEVCSRMRLRTVLEMDKTHPRDWANPGRVRVCLKDADTGKPSQSLFKNKHTLLCAIGELLRAFQPADPGADARLTDGTTESGAKVTAAKGKQPPKGPLPPIHHRLPPYSPAVSVGTLDDAIQGRGGMNDLLGGMLGGAGGPGDGEAESAAQQQQQQMPKLQKPKVKHIRKRR